VVKLEYSHHRDTEGTEEKIIYMKNLIQKYEYEELRVNEESFTENHFNSLVKFNDRHKSKYFTICHKKIKFSNYVGLIKIGNFTIEILPKADKNAGEDEQDKWHDALIQMLRIAGEIDLKEYNNANLELHHGSLFDIYISMFLSEFENLIHNGLQKKYRLIQENTKIFKGKLLLNNHLRENIIHKERFYNEFDAYDYDNKLNQILFCALNILCGFTLNSEFKNRIACIKMILPEISLKKITEKDFLNLSYNRSFKNYEYALRLAKLIILNFNPGIKSGSENVMAFLFDMNLLFEKFVYKLLKRREDGSYQVKYQKGTQFWNTKLLKPDIVFTYLKSKKSVTIDTKWKLPKDNSPSDQDLKQMYVYNKYFDTTHAILLYPSPPGSKLNVPGKYKKIENEAQLHCSMRSFNLEFNDNKLDTKETWEKIIDAINL
jgi:5-methylcytosine-specific restriction enzyme subunit McrC